MPGAMNPDIVDYAGPIDPQVGVIGAWDVSGKLLGTHRQLLLPRDDESRRHLRQLDLLHGAHDPGRARYARARGVPAGACGDVAQVDNLSPYDESAPGSMGAARRRPRRGGSGESAAEHAARAATCRSDARQKTWAIKRRAPSAEHRGKARAIVARGKRPPDLSDWTVRARRR